MSRVLRRNGRLLVLEFSLPTIPIVRAIYRFYLHRCLPVMGFFLTRKKSAYHYLGGSIEEFPSGRAMIDLIEENDFGGVVFRRLTYGVATIYTAQRL
jgi:demethylmenaquinone methyltransferase/2-methoxy-6-polyprenyl-1,4-benzoquinol methylase